MRVRGRLSGQLCRFRNPKGKRRAATLLGRREQAVDGLLEVRVGLRALQHTKYLDGGAVRLGHAQEEAGRACDPGVDDIRQAKRVLTFSFDPIAWIT